MKVFIVVLVLIFSLQSWTKADDIRDFEIEGMSIGDSALDFFSEADIKKNSKNYYKNKKYTPVENNNFDFFNTYDAVDFNFKTGDKNYIFETLSGIIFTNNMNECLKKQKQIVKDLSSIFTDATQTDKDKIYNDDHWKGTRNVQFTFWLNNGGIASVHCNDYSKDHGGQDHLNINLKTDKFNDFLRNQAYK